MKRLIGFTITVCFCALLWFSLAPARAQSVSGSISGIVTGSFGAVIANTTVRAMALSANLKYTAVADRRGFYSLPVLPAEHQIAFEYIF